MRAVMEHEIRGKLHLADHKPLHLDKRIIELPFEEHLLRWE